MKYNNSFNYISNNIFYGNKNNKTRKKFKKIVCSPKKKKNFTCYTKKELKIIKRNWNNSKKDKKDKIQTNNSKKIWHMLKNNLKDKCNNEQCWLNQNFMDNSKLKYKKNIFAPQSPNSWKTNITEWLSNHDILNVMRQYENVYPKFLFIGPSSIDYNTKIDNNNCVCNKLCKFNLKKILDDKKEYISIVFNTDKHYQSGSHWICLFINIKKKYIYFFDSNGNPPPSNVITFIDDVISQGEKLKIKFKYIFNKKIHQKSNTECGIYVLVITILLLKNKREPKDFNKRINDETMIEARKILFNI